MGKSCCAIRCAARFAKNSNTSFYRLPHSQERRSEWLKAMRRTRWRSTGEKWLCSGHFVSGKKSNDPQHPDYVPSIFSCTSTTKRARAVRSLEKYLRFKEMSEKRLNNTERLEAATALLLLQKSLGGRVTDKYLTEHCGFLDKLLPGDLVLADRGFTVEDSIGLGNLFSAFDPSFNASGASPQEQ
ncbi:hypothetical protein WMY93_005900 [Mugilogobius chulae]|uniref:THAP-type domain-containing protein n=1 Tax=Mugilogobius chulae TaxID=88201 RepID=A0AAW0PI32_9GOBI